MSSFDLQSTYVHLAPDGAASRIEVTPDFWSTIKERRELDDGRLIGVFSSSADWTHWEMHPEGEELLVLLSGEMTIVFDEPGKPRHVELQPGRSCLVPRGIWHRALVPVPSELLSITYGRGTAHRPL